MKKILLFTLVLSTQVLALETDNYISWNVELLDAREKINQYMNGEIAQTLKEKAGKAVSCKELTLAIGEKFRTSPPKKHPMEDFLKFNLSEEYVYPKKHQYRLDSIYQHLFRFYLKYVELAPNMQVGGIYFGTDKLSHFVSTGRRYYEHYKKKIKRGATPEEAVKSAIIFGLKNERSVLGTWSSGVFSYGDMEANYQGLKFYLRLCEGDNTYLVYDEATKTWQQRELVKVEEYINPYWDESFNPSYRLPKNWKRTSPTIKRLYCEARGQERVVKRFEHYRALNHQSFSLDYIEQLKKEDSKYTPDPLKNQSVEQLCGL